MHQPSSKIIIVTIIVILLALFSLRTPYINEVHQQEISVSLCQIHLQYDPTNAFNYRALLSLLAILKIHDFQIGQPVWGPANMVLYLCEHRLKTGLNLTTIDKQLNTVIKNSGLASKHLGWACA